MGGISPRSELSTMQTLIQAGQPRTRPPMGPALSWGCRFSPKKVSPPTLFTLHPHPPSFSLQKFYSRKASFHHPPLIGQKLHLRHDRQRILGPESPSSQLTCRQRFRARRGKLGRAQTTSPSALCLVSKGVILREVDWCSCPKL